MLTTITDKTLKAIIELSGHAIRDFLARAEPAKFNGEAQLAIRSFQAAPSAFSDDKLVRFGADTVKATNYPVRIEVRGKTKEGAAQMVAKGIWGPKRNEAVRQIYQKCKKLGLGLHLKLAGTSSIEFNIDGVDKSLPLRYLQRSFESILKEMHYKPGLRINSLKSRTVIAADGDGTVYDGPRVGCLPTLAESPVKKPLCAYLKAGGLFMLVSGNDLNRSFKRLVEALPPQVYSRVLVAANGGSDLVYVNAKGKAVPVCDYKRKALGMAQDKIKAPNLDMIYIGDDGSKQGNDYPAFKAVGFKNSVLVAPKFLAEFDSRLKKAHVGGLLQGTAKYLKRFLSSRL